MTALAGKYAFRPGYDAKKVAAQLVDAAGLPSPEALERGARLFRAEAKRQAEARARAERISRPAGGAR